MAQRYLVETICTHGRTNGLEVRKYLDTDTGMAYIGSQCTKFSDKVKFLVIRKGYIVMFDNLPPMMDYSYEVYINNTLIAGRSVIQNCKICSNKLLVIATTTDK